MIRKSPPSLQDKEVAANVRAFVDAATAATGITNWSTYSGHLPSWDLALDCWGTIEQRRRLSEFVIEHAAEYGVWYQIRGARVGGVPGPGGQIWNPGIAPHWRSMEDRGGPTANHDDHNHISFRSKEMTMPHDHTFEEWARPHLEALAENLRLDNAEMRERHKAHDEALDSVLGALERIMDRLERLEAGESRPHGRVTVTGELEIGDPGDG